MTKKMTTKRKKINVTLAEFKAGLQRVAETLRRHGLADPADRNRGYRKKRVTRTGILPDVKEGDILLDDEAV